MTHRNDTSTPSLLPTRQSKAAFDAANLSSGREFYDDGYTEEELNLAEPPSSLNLNGGSASRRLRPSRSSMSGEGSEGTGPSQAPSLSASSMSFFPRNKELARLTYVRDAVMTGPSSANDKQHQQLRGNDKSKHEMRQRGQSRERSSKSPSGDKAASPIPSKSAQAPAGNGDASDKPKILARNSSSLSISASKTSLASATTTRVLARRKCLPAALVCGTSGTGKSKLVEHFLKQNCCTCAASKRHRIKCTCCYILRGKYDEYIGSSDPFSAIVQALTDFARQLKHVDPKEFARIRHCVAKAFDEGAEAQAQSAGDDEGLAASETTAPSAASSGGGGSRSDANGNVQKSVLSALTVVVPSLSMLFEETKTASASATATNRNNSNNKNDGAKTGTPKGQTAPTASQSARVQRAMSKSTLDDELDGSNDSKDTHGMEGGMAALARRGGADNSPTQSTSEEGGDSTNNAWNRLQYIFTQFVKAICTPQRPIYLFLDDLQWSSDVGLEMLSNLISDPQLQNFMFFGTIRHETNPHTGESLMIPPESPLRNCFLERLGADENTPGQEISGKDGEKSSNLTVGRDGASSANDKVNDGVMDRKLEQIYLDNFTEDETGRWLSQLLNRAVVELEPLTKKLHATTDGNILFLLESLQELERNHVLVYSRISFQWEWNLQGSSNNKEEIPISDSITAVLKSKLLHMPEELQQVLSIAAYIRTNFDTRLLQLLLTNEKAHASGIMQDGTAAGEGGSFRSGRESSAPLTSEQGAPAVPDQQRLEELLEQAVLERIILNPIGDSTYSFAHDKVREAAYGMVPFGETRDKLRLRIGHCLLDLCKKSIQSTSKDLQEQQHLKQTSAAWSLDGSPQEKRDDIDNLLFVAADHLNSVPTKDHLFIVKLNLEVGERALKIAAIASAATYLHKAATSMKKVRDPWGQHYDLSLRLHRARADVELTLGHYDAGYKIAEETTSRARTLDEKLPTYVSLVHALGRQDRQLDALNLTLDTMRMMNMFPKRWCMIHVMKDLSKIKSYLRRHTDDQIVNLPRTTHRRAMIAMKLHTAVQTRAFVTKKFLIWLTSVCKCVKLTIKYGICAGSANGFVSYGLFLSANGDHKAAVRSSDLGHRILTSIKDKSTGGLIHMASGMFIYPFSRPLSQVIQHIREGYVMAMMNGEFETGFLTWQSCIIMAFCAGYELKSLIRTTEITLQQYKTYRVKSMMGMATSYLEVMKILHGVQPLDWDEVRAISNHVLEDDGIGSAEHYTLSFKFFTHMSLATYFFKYDMAEKIFKLFYRLNEQNKSYGSETSRCLFMGLIGAAQYRIKKKRRYLTMLRSAIRTLHKSSKTKGRNCMHHLFILEAEEAASTKSAPDPQNVKNLYDLAVLVATKVSHVQDAALACELAGEHFVRQGQHDMVSSYFAMAAEYYIEWGATIKVQHVLDRRGKYIEHHAMQKIRRKLDGDVEEDDGIVSNFTGSESGSGAQRTQLDFLASTQVGLDSAMEAISENGPPVHPEDTVSVLTDLSGY